MRWLALALLILCMPILAEARYGERFCNDFGVECYKVQRGDSWQSLWPDPSERDIIKRFNRLNIPLRRGMRIAVPHNSANLDVMDISPFDSRIQGRGNKVVIIDLAAQAFAAYDARGYLVHWGPAVGGAGWCRDVGRSCRTPRGKFSFYQKRSGGCRSMKYPLPNGGAKMPYCMFFRGGYAVHGSYQVPGYHASHGCVRTFIDDARWLNQKFIELPHQSSSRRGTEVIITSY